jgi:predicted enzyme related to lactoylglutathione lyase
MDSGIACVWANLPEEVADWYENDYLPRQDSINALHTIHCEVTASGMENEPVGRLDSPWPWLTVYEVQDVDKANNEINTAAADLPEEAKTGPLKDVRFDIRTYREVKRWQDDDWEGNGGAGKNVSSDKAHPGLMSLDIEHVASVAAMEWTVGADKEEEVLKFYHDIVGPTISASPDVLRFRLFKVDSGRTVDKGQKTTPMDKATLHKYFTLVELEAEEWPWDVVVDLAEERGWKDYFESQTVVVRFATLTDAASTNSTQKWQLSHYLAKSAVYGTQSKASAS